MRIGSLAIVLFLFWLALSGHYNTFLLTVGILTTALCVFVAHRMGATDEEGHPVHLTIGALSYFPWLLWEIVKSAWTVTKIIIDPKLPITPTLIRVRATQTSSVGLNVYANSITLTPGTITTHVDDDQLTVHALVGEGADDLEAGGMNERVCRFEKGF